MSRDPAKSRPLTANVMRLMRLSRASPKNSQVVKFGRSVDIPDIASCTKQGNLFMEAASMGFPMQDFAPKFMTSQLAGIFDVAFAESNGTDGTGLVSFLQIPMLLKSPELIVETLYWIDDVVERAKDNNKAAAIVTAYESEMMRLPEALEALPSEPNRNVDELSYAFWLGYMYRYECLMHEESSRMVYGVFTESIMRGAYRRLMQSPMGDRDLAESAGDICAELDRLLIEVLWPERLKQQKHLQAKELERSGNNG